MLTVCREDPIAALDSSGTLMTECVSQSGRHERLCSPGGFQFHPSSRKPLQDEQMGQAQSHFESLLLLWVLEHVKFPGHFLREQSLFPTAFRLSQN